MYILGLSRKAKDRGSYIGARLAKQAGRENCDAMLDQGETFGWGRRIGKAEERELGVPVASRGVARGESDEQDTILTNQIE